MPAQFFLILFIVSEFATLSAMQILGSQGRGTFPFFSQMGGMGMGQKWAYIIIGNVNEVLFIKNGYEVL